MNLDNADAPAIASSILTTLDLQPVTPDTKTPIEGQPTVKELLDESRRWHITYRDSKRRRSQLGAAVAIVNAARLRAQAELADPDHLDVAWMDEGGTHALGKASHDALNRDLLVFYFTQLTPQAGATDDGSSNGR